MKLSTYKPTHQAGYALVIILLTLVVMIVVFTSILYWASSNARVTVRNNAFNNAEEAAESSTENILATMIRDFTYNNLSTANTYATLFPPTNGWPEYFIFSDTNGNKANAASVYIADQVWTNFNSQYNGLYGISQPCIIASRATMPESTGTSNISATIEQSVEFALIPLFQFAVFYNMDLEDSPGAAMTINGAVWSNGNIWSSPSATLTYNGTVSAAGKIYYTRNPNDPQANGSSNDVVYKVTVNNPLINESTLTMPVGASTNNNPTNVMAILYPPPASMAPPNFTGAYSTNGFIYLQNAVDLIISNAVNGTNGTMGTNLYVWYQNPNDSASYLTPVPGDVLISSNVTAGHVTNLVTAFSWVTNVSFYDYREMDTVQSVQVNVGALNTWLNTTGPTGGAQFNSLNTSGSTSKAHQINSIYVYNSVPLTPTQLPAVRMSNGAQLPPNGLTVVTPQPMYVQGNYNTQTNTTGGASTATTNTAYTYPAALMADAVTVLSQQWKDTYTSSTSLSGRTVTSADTVNAALLVGIDPSITANGTKYFSGGLENYLRLLENWNSEPLWYNGSEVAMFNSAYATNYWQSPGVYYQIPTRDWGFDANFMNPNKLPPLAPQVRATIRGYWYAW